MTLSYDPFDPSLPSNKAAADPAPVVLDEEDKAAVCEQLRSLAGTLMQVESFVGSEGVTKGMVYNALRLTVSRAQTLAALAGVELTPPGEREELQAKLRAANGRVRELEREQGTAVTGDQIRTGLQVLCSKLKQWWGEHGLGHVSDISVGDYGLMKVNFSSMLQARLRYGEGAGDGKSAEERRAEWHGSLIAQGFVLVEDGSQSEVLDCEASRIALSRLVLGQFPSATIFQVSSTRLRAPGSQGETLFSFNEISVYIRDLGEVAALPMPVQ